MKRDSKIDKKESPWKKVKIKEQHRTKMRKKISKKKEKPSEFPLPKNLKKIEWTDKMSVHENIIDKQHKSLLEQISHLMGDIQAGKEIDEVRQAMHFLFNYAKEHFSYEEGYMKKINYPNKEFIRHKKIHEGFIAFSKRFCKDFNDNYLNQKYTASFSKDYIIKIKKFMQDWLVSHIMRVDHKIYEFYKKNGNGKVNFSSIKSQIESQLKKQRENVSGIPELKPKRDIKEHLLTNVPGFDELFQSGIPKESSVLVAGGAGSGKTIFCLQTMFNQAKDGKKCIYLTLEESEDKLIKHMGLFGWDARDLIKKDKIQIIRVNPFDIARSVDAMLAKEKGELLIDVDPVLLPRGFKPDFLVIDSLTAIASAFTGKEDSYRIYIEQLFRFFEKLKATSFLITETEQVPKIYSTTGVEEFLADGVIVLYNIKRGDVRENAIEVLKMRGEKHQKKIVAMQITDRGIVVYPEQEVFGEI